MLKKILYVIFCLCLAAMLFACGNDNTGEASASGGNSFAKKIDKAKLVSKYTKEDCLDDFDSVEFGKYMQNDTAQTPIEWVVLDRVDGKALLISKYVLDHKKYNEVPDDSVTWETSSLRAWLNNEFYNTAFNEEEKNMICLSEVPAEDGIESYQYALGKYKDVSKIVKGGNATNDNVFILSFNEKKKYSGFWKGSASLPTEYAKTVEINGYKLSYYNNLIGTDRCSWWLRSPGKSKNYFESVIFSGQSNDEGGSKSNTVGIGVRPVIWVKYK